MKNKGTYGKRIENLENEISKLNKHIDMHIIEDLQKTRFTGSDKPLYTYDEIAEKHDIPKSRVQKVAEDNNLTRRKFKVIK